MHDIERLCLSRLLVETELDPVLAPRGGDHRCRQLLGDADQQVITGDKRGDSLILALPADACLAADQADGDGHLPQDLRRCTCPGGGFAQAWRDPGYRLQQVKRVLLQAVGQERFRVGKDGRPTFPGPSLGEAFP